VNFIDRQVAASLPLDKYAAAAAFYSSSVEISGSRLSSKLNRRIREIKECPVVATFPRRIGIRHQRLIMTCLTSRAARVATAALDFLAISNGNTQRRFFGAQRFHTSSYVVIVEQHES